MQIWNSESTSVILHCSKYISADDINGEAFMDLKEKDLSDMGFTKGQRMKILKIIDSVKVWQWQVFNLLSVCIVNYIHIIIV